jgi:riboflavin synthase
MFSGIVAALGRVAALDRAGGDLRMVIDCGTLELADVVLGDSIAVSGVCLTVVAIDGATLAFDVSNETLALTSLGRLAVGATVNLEKALRLADRLGGHLVSGHVDGLGRVLAIAADARAQRWRIALPAELAKFVATKGSITVDGVSLTVNAVGPDWFEIALIPHTLAVTTLGGLAVGTVVNLEVDLIARYVERMLAGERA